MLAWMVPLLIWIGEVVLKWLPWEEVVEFMQMLPMFSTATLGLEWCFFVV